MSHYATNWAIQQRGLKPATKIVLWHLCDRHNPDFGCFPSQELLAENAEMSRSALNEHLLILEKAGLIRRLRSVNRRTGKRERTRYILRFEKEWQQEPCPNSGHGEPETEEEHGDDPCPDSGQGSMSGFPADPCPDFAENHVRNPDNNPVREPLKEPVKEEGAPARDDFDLRFGELREALGFSADDAPAGWWRPDAAKSHVLRWVVELRLGWERVIEIARASRDGHGVPPDGPKALDRSMARAARSVRTGKPDRDKPPASDEDQLQFYAEWINSSRYLPTSAISVRTVRELTIRGLVTAERARERGL